MRRSKLTYLPLIGRRATAGETDFGLGDVVSFSGAEEAGALGIVQALWQTKSGDKSMQVRSVLRGSETVLGDAASLDELFVTAKLLTRYAVHKRTQIEHSQLRGGSCAASKGHSQASTKFFIVGNMVEVNKREGRCIDRKTVSNHTQQDTRNVLRGAKLCKPLKSWVLV